MMPLALFFQHAQQQKQGETVDENLTNGERGSSKRTDHNANAAGSLAANSQIVDNFKGSSSGGESASQHHANVQLESNGMSYQSCRMIAQQFIASLLTLYLALCLHQTKLVLDWPGNFPRIVS